MSGVCDWADVRLTPVDDADLEKLNAWQNDPAIRDLTMGFRGPVATEITKQWIEGVRAQNLHSRILYAIRHRGALKGICQIHSIDWPHRKGIFGLYIGDPADRASGLGSMSTTLLLDYAFRSLDFERIELEVIAPNTRAKSLYESLGFTREGALRNAYLYNGARVDIEIYGMLKGEWRRAPPEAANRLVYASAA